MRYHIFYFQSNLKLSLWASILGKPHLLHSSRIWVRCVHNLSVLDKDLKYLEVDIATSEAVPVTILVHHLGLDHGNSVLLELWFCKQASLNGDVRKVDSD